jgi:Tol biopolymer transport system component
MTPERWRQVEDLYHAAVAREPQARAAFLDEACGGDLDLRARVESMVAAHERAGPFIATPAPEAAPELLRIATRPAAVVTGQVLGHYRIESVLGAGGMGEVYRARDTRLDRTVAVKVLPSPLASDPAHRARFEREARAISKLNHPHICTLHDVGAQDGIEYLVMELVEGETLGHRLRNGPLRIEEVLRLGAQMAEALWAAHRQGIVHRDLKPGNVMVAKSGVKLLDFGLAKLRPEGLRESGAVSALAMGSRPLTGEGTIVGTLSYMSPEQLEGREADARTDIWALGTVLYEMATGQQAFGGTSQASVIAAILEKEPAPIASLQPMSPSALDRVVRTCLAKDPDERWQSARDVTSQLRWIGEGDPQAAVLAAAPSRRTRWRTAGPALALALAVATVALLPFRRAPVMAPRSVRFVITPPEGTAFGSFTQAAAVAVSPDGTRIAFTTTAASGKTQLWLRDLDDVVPRPLPGTEGAAWPFWSPGGRSLGFFAGGKLKRIEVAGGLPQTLCDALEPRGATWSADGVIIFASRDHRALLRVPSAGGTPIPETSLLSGEIGHGGPSFLPDGRRYIFYVAADEGRRHEIHVATLGGKDHKKVTDAHSAALFSPPGFLLFTREGSLLAQRFDARTGEVSGDPIPVAEHVGRSGGAGAPAQSPFSVSANGVLAHGSAPHIKNRMLWFDRKGTVVGSVGPEGDYADLALSPDGRKLALCRDDPETDTPDIWIADLVRGSFARFTFHPQWDVYPVWSPDGSRLVFGWDRQGPEQLYTKPVSGGAEERLLETVDSAWPTDWSPDGRSIVYLLFNDRTRADLWLLPLEGDRKPRPLLQTPFNEAEAQISPDGRWLAYTSDEPGRPEVYVAPLPAMNERWQVSTEGGRRPTWRRDQKELFFVAADRTLMSAEIAVGPVFRAAAPRALFQTRIVNSPFPGFRSLYVPDAAGQRFLVVTEPESFTSPPITVVLDWTAGLIR